MPQLACAASWQLALSRRIHRARDHISDSPLSLVAVDGGERAVMFDRFRGVLDDVYDEGTWLMVPWLQNPQIMDIRTRPRVISSVTGTGDLQMVNLSLRVLSRPDKSDLPWIVKVRACRPCLAPALATAQCWLRASAHWSHVALGKLPQHASIDSAALHGFARHVLSRTHAYCACRRQHGVGCRI